MNRLARTSLLLAGLLGATLFLTHGARAGDAPAGEPAATPTLQKVADQPLMKALVGAWSIAQKSDLGEHAGTTTFALGLGGTTLVQDYEVEAGPMGTFSGHGVYRVSEDGKKLNLWWFDTGTLAPILYTGALTATGYDLKGDNGLHLTIAKKDAAFEFRLEIPGVGAFTDTYTKR
jgi:hypothetical protein